jgi:hypothetical protein
MSTVAAEKRERNSREVIAMGAGVVLSGWQVGVDDVS